MPHADFVHLRVHSAFSLSEGAILISDLIGLCERHAMPAVAVTDSGNEIGFSDDPGKAGVNNLLGIYKVITGKSEDEVESDFANARGYGDLKQTVSDVVIAALTPIRERYDDLIGDVAELDRLLARGADRARSVAQPKVDEMKRRVGLVVPTGA